jgi:lipid-A-disaccharide synthase
VTRPLVFLVAGEPSGDVLGARLMAALKRRTGGEIDFVGIGGPAMAEEGLVSRFPMSELSLLGIAEILPHIPQLRRRIAETVAGIKELNPDVLVTIDAPAFCLRVSRQLAEIVPRIHYVAPQHWAWRPGRAHDLARATDHLMALLPFEPEFFARYGVDCAFVGHPVVEGGAGQGDAARFRRRHAIPEDSPVLTVLLGSRRGEVRRLLPVFERAVERLHQLIPDLRVVLPTVPHLASQIGAAAEAWPMPTILVEDRQDKFDAFAASTAALAASGTVALELALSGTPSVIAYRVHPVTGLLVKLLLNVRHVSLINIITGRGIVPELIQGNCRPDRIADEIGRLLTDPAARATQRAGFAELAERMGVGGPSPGDRAAAYVLDVLATSSGRQPGTR